MKIAIDFDGTIVEHLFPEIGSPNPGAIEWMKRFQDAGAKLILFTMRANGDATKDGGKSEYREYLTEAVEYCRSKGVEFFGVNRDPEQDDWTASPKAYAHIYIDDAAFGCPLRENPRMGGRPMVDWDQVGPKVLEAINDR